MQTIGWKTLFTDMQVHRKSIALGQLYALVTVLISLPIPLMFPLLIDQVLLQKPGWLTGAMDAVFSPEQPYVYILIVLATTLVLRAGFLIMNVIQSRLFTRISKHVVFNLRTRLLEHLKKVSVAEYEALGGGGVSSKLVTDINTVDDFISVSIGRFFVSILSLVGIAVVLGLISWPLALIIFVVNPTVVFVTVWLGRKVRKLKQRENRKIETFQNELGETLDLFVQIRTYNQEHRYIDSTIQNARAIRDASTSFGWKSDGAAQLSSFVFLSGFELFRASAMLMVLFSDLSIGSMMAVIGYLWFMITPLQELLGIIYAYQNATGSLERLNALMRLEREPEYPHELNPFAQSETNAIELENVCFSYGDKPVLHDVSLSIPKGKTVALLGPSGSGKTTLAQIILGLYAKRSGHIRVDGVEIERIGLDVLRENVAMVLQTPRLFNDTLRHNLTLGREINDLKLLEALSVAQFDRVLERLDKGLDTVVGKEGVRLSGGERQRLSIARMLVSDPNVVILDESTSALDVHTEANLFKSLRRHLEGKTMLIIAHRLSTVEHADLIYVLKEGRVIEAGTPAELLGSHGHYRRFVDAQKR